MITREDVIEEIINNLNINDVYLLLYIAYKYFEKLKRSQAMMKRIAALLGSSSTSPREEFIARLMESYLQQQLPQQQPQLGDESLQGDIERVKRILEIFKEKLKEKDQDKK